MGEEHSEAFTSQGNHKCWGCGAEEEVGTFEDRGGYCGSAWGPGEEFNEKVGEEGRADHAGPCIQDLWGTLTLTENGRKVREGGTIRVRKKHKNDKEHLAVCYALGTKRRVFPGGCGQCVDCHWEAGYVKKKEKTRVGTWGK